jgi:hypothetical protein
VSFSETGRLKFCLKEFQHLLPTVLEPDVSSGEEKATKRLAPTQAIGRQPAPVLKRFVRTATVAATTSGD